MADFGSQSQTKITKNSKILCTVEDALEDVIVVSFAMESKTYQGVLLDSTKRNTPYGITFPKGYYSTSLGNSNRKTDKEDDKFCSVSQRHTYFQENTNARNTLQLRRTIRLPARYKNSKMTVRLRPRQVLCSKCKSICNENSENVDLSKKKGSKDNSEKDVDKLQKPGRGYGIGTRRSRSLLSENQRENQDHQQNKTSPVSIERSSPMSATLIPKLQKLQPTELTNTTAGSVNKIKIVGNFWKRPLMEMKEESKEVTAVPSSDWTTMLQASEDSEMFVKSDMNEMKLCRDFNGSRDSSVGISLGQNGSSQQQCSTIISSGKKMILRKKKSVGSMEDLWDETVFEEGGVKSLDSEKKARMAKTTPVIKISFGSQGKGTVLKIPSKVQCYNPSESETEDKAEEARNQKTKDASAKAAKKALKRAKKEAQRKSLLAGLSPARSLGGASPAYVFGGMSPAHEIFHHRRHKHKVKHKKKHKDEKKHKEHENEDYHGNDVEIGMTDADGMEQNVPGDSYSAIKERCLKQKLSISLKRLNANAYMRCDSANKTISNSSNGNPEFFQVSSTTNAFGNEDSRSTATSSNSDSGSASNDDQSEEVPDFPPSDPSGNDKVQPLMMRITTQSVDSCVMSRGRVVSVNDVVWGKIHGFPWWPGKVLNITVAKKDNGMLLTPQAHVGWYASSTSSLLPCDQLSPYVETFKARYNKKKRGPYKEAIRQASYEAQVPPQLLMSNSPQEVDVLS